MEVNLQLETRICMQRRDLWHNNVKPGSSLTCDSGVLWVTQAADLTDHILLPGDTMAIVHRGKVLVEAMRNASFHLA